MRFVPSFTDVLVLAREGAKKFANGDDISQAIGEFLAEPSMLNIELIPGEVVYEVFFDRDDPEASCIEESRVTGVGFAGFTLASDLDDDPDNMGDLCPWGELGIDVFTTIEEATAALEALLEAAP